MLILMVEIHPDRAIAAPGDAEPVFQWGHIQSGLGERMRKDPANQDRTEWPNSDRPSLADHRSLAAERTVIIGEHNVAAGRAVGLCPEQDLLIIDLKRHVGTQRVVVGQ